MPVLPACPLSESGVSSVAEESGGFLESIDQFGGLAEPISAFFQPVLTALMVLSLLAVGVVFLLLEWQGRKRRDEGSVLHNSGELFLHPPGVGWTFTPETGRQVYIARRGLTEYNIYLLKGARPGVALDYDSYGQYFTLQCWGGRRAVQQLVIGIYENNLTAMQHLS